MRGVRCKMCEETFIQRLHAGEVSAGCCAPLRTKKQLTTVRGSLGDSPVAWGASSARKIRANLLVCSVKKCRRLKNGRISPHMSEKQTQGKGTGIEVTKNT